MPVYTRRGDGGETYLANGQRVNKNHLRVELYGTVDELNSAIGLAVACLKDENTKALHAELCSQQQLLFELGSELAGYKKAPASENAISPEDTLNLEKSMDRMEKRVGPVRNFILPGGTIASAALHLARTTCRRLERQMTALIHEKQQKQGAEQKMIIKKEAYTYINRLSDYLFMAARYANSLAQVADIPWHKRQA